MKRRRHETRGRILFPLFVALIIGGIAGWYLRDRLPPAYSREVADLASPPRAAPAATTGTVDAPPAITPSAGGSLPASSRNTETVPVPEVPPPTIGADPVAELRRHALRLPLDDVDVEKMKSAFAERRDRGARPHEAADLMAPRMTPVLAVESGRIARLFLSKAGGTTIYQFDPTERYCYYYAHLQQYAPGLAEGQMVKAGDIIGFVGSSGNASPDAPHLHFAIFKLTDAKRWWEGTPIDPYLVFRK